MIRQLPTPACARWERFSTLPERNRRYQHFLHARMKEDNRSRHMSDYHATKVRGYSLFERA